MLDTAHFIMENCKRDLGIGGVNVDLSSGEIGSNYGVAKIGKLKKLAIEISDKHIKSFRQLAQTIAHEVRHIWQAVTGFKFSSPGVNYSSRNEEIDAERYAQKYNNVPETCLE